MTQWCKDGTDARRLRHSDTIKADEKGVAEFIVDPPCLGFRFTAIDARTERFGGPPFQVEVRLHGGTRVIDRCIAASASGSQPMVFEGAIAHIVANQGLYIRVTGRPLDVFAFVFSGEAPDGFSQESDQSGEPEKSQRIDLIPTPATHRYVGMWRPPFETLFLRPAAPLAEPVRVSFIDCPCRSACFTWDSMSNRPRDEKKLLEHWLAGHFDSPQYELKEKA